jgi:hypothetical protein
VRGCYFIRILRQGNLTLDAPTKAIVLVFSRISRRVVSLFWKSIDRSITIVPSLFAIVVVNHDCIQCFSLFGRLPVKTCNSRRAHKSHKHAVSLYPRTELYYCRSGTGVLRTVQVQPVHLLCIVYSWPYCDKVSYTIMLLVTVVRCALVLFYGRPMVTWTRHWHLFVVFTVYSWGCDEMW